MTDFVRKRATSYQQGSCSAVLGKCKYVEKGVDGAARGSSQCGHEAVVPVPDKPSETLLEAWTANQFGPLQKLPREHNREEASRLEQRM